MHHAEDSAEVHRLFGRQPGPSSARATAPARSARSTGGTPAGPFLWVGVSRRRSRTARRWSARSTTSAGTKLRAWAAREAKDRLAGGDVAACVVEELHPGHRVASYRHRAKRGSFTTVPARMREAHRRPATWTPGRLTAWIERTRPATGMLLAAIIASRPHPEQIFHSMPPASCAWAGAIGSSSSSPPRRGSHRGQP